MPPVGDHVYSLRLAMFHPFHHALSTLLSRKVEVMRRPMKTDCLAKIKSLGVPVGAVLDVGVQTCTIELLDAYPHNHHLLMEPIVEYNETIRDIYGKRGASFEVVNAAISDRDGEVTMRTAAVFKNYGVSHARMTDEIGEGENFRRCPMRTLDSLIADRDLKAPFLLKIDVDGAELQVIGGAQKTLQQCSVVMIEVGVRNIIERAQAVIEAGFEPFDIIDLAYYDDRWVQADMVFLNRAMVRDYGLTLYADGFDASKWQVFGKEKFAGNK